MKRPCCSSSQEEDGAESSLQLSYVPEKTRHRDEELDQIASFLSSSTGGTLYVCGGPGTGKTLHVERAAARRDQQQDSKIVWLRGTSFGSGEAFVAGLARSLSLKSEVWNRLSSKEAVAAFEEAMIGGRRRQKTCRVVIDEMDSLVAVAGEAARRVFRVAGNPRNKLALVAIANSIDLPMRALQAFRSAIDRAPELFEAHINLGRTLRARGDVRGAQGAFQTAVGLSPADADGHLGLGLVTGGDEGAQHLQRAAELAPYEDAALLALGDIHAAEGRYDEAVETYREALRRSGRNAAGYVKLGNALVRTRSDADAQVAFNAAIALDEDLAPAHNGLGTCLAALGQVEDAQASFERAAALDDSDPHPLMNLAVLHARHGDRREAEARWADAQSRRPGLGPLPR
ncbi:MAG: tetratricopeptide repeat protein [Myxococcota bacterium]